MKNKHSALLLIEFQNEWISEKGRLNHLFNDQKQFINSLEKAEKVLEHTRTTPMKIIHSALTYSNDYKELGQAKQGLRATIAANKTFLKNTFASEFAEQFMHQDGEFVTEGRIGSSAFSGSNLDSYLRNNQIQTLYIMGYALHVCVESTLRAAHDLGYEAVIIDDACSAFNDKQRKYVIENIIHHFGSHIKSKDFINL